MSAQRAREAAARGGWEEAYDLLMEADTDDPGDLRLLVPRASAERLGFALPS